jgi:hypothetical protein
MVKRQPRDPDRSAEQREDEPSPAVREQATYIAKVVRGSMEDFHCEHLSDAQMRELNPIIRNVICTSLHAVVTHDEYEASRYFVEESVRGIPDYWESPQLTGDFLGLVELLEKRGTGPA